MEENRVELVIRPILPKHASAIADLEARCNGSAKWSEAAYRSAGANGRAGWISQSDNHISGFILVRIVADEMEILNLAVDPDVRRRRIGSTLVNHAIEEARQANVKQIHLEVRESNAAARAFYLSMGFAERGRRKNYYSQPIEDALLLVFHLH